MESALSDVIRERLLDDRVLSFISGDAREQVGDEGEEEWHVLGHVLGEIH